VNKLYARDDQWEWFEDESNTIMYLNGGYRFRFSGGFFINTGAFLGAAISKSEWDYTDPSYGSFDTDSRSGTDVVPFGMLEVTFGIEL